MSEQSRSDVLPTIVVRDPPVAVGERVLGELAQLNGLGALLALLAGSGEGARAGLRSLVRSLIDDGSRYAQTPDGQRWATLLSESPVVTNGWLLWNHSNVDFYLRNAEPLRDSPGALLEAALSELARGDLAELLMQLSRLSARIDADQRAHGGVA